VPDQARSHGDNPHGRRRPSVTYLLADTQVASSSALLFPGLALAKSPCAAPRSLKGLPTHGTDVILELAAAIAGLLLGLVLMP